MHSIRTLLCLLVAALAFSGCATPNDTRSAGHVVIPATGAGQTTWVPGEPEIRDIEAQLSNLFYNPDARVSGLNDQAPYPLGEYMIRYTVAGPTDQAYVLGEAVHKSRPESSKQLDPNHPGFDPKTVKGTLYFSFLFDVKSGRIREVLFNTR